MIYGIDALGIAKYPNIDIPEGFALGAFANTFGDSLILSVLPTFVKWFQRLGE